MAQATPVEVPLNEADGFMPDVKGMQRQVTFPTRMVIVNTPCDPTGAVYDRSCLDALARIAAEHDLLVVSDEIYGKMVYIGAEHIGIASLPNMALRTLLLNGFSKNYTMTGRNIGYVAAPATLIAAVLRIRQYVTVCPTTFAQRGAFVGLRGSQSCVSEMVAEFARRLLLVYVAFSDRYGIRTREPRGAYYALPNMSQLPLAPKGLSRYLLHEDKIAMVPWGKSHIRLSYANSYENFQKAMNRLKQAIKRLKASNRPANHQNSNDAIAAGYP